MPIDVAVYDVPRECPPVDAFRAAVTGDTTPLRFGVRVVRTGGGFRGTLTVARDDEATSRTLESPTCDELVRALALVAGLAREETQDEARAEPTTAAASPADASPGPPAFASPPRGRPVGARPSPTSRPVSAVVGRIGAVGAVERVTLPAPTIAAAIFLELAFPRPSAAPAVRVTASRSADSDASVGNVGRGTFHTFSLRADLCPARIAWSAVEVTACGRFDFVSLDVNATAGTSTQRSSRNLFAIGVPLRGRLHLPGSFFAELEIAGEAPFSRERYVLAPSNATLHELPTFGWIAGLGAGVTID